MSLPGGCATRCSIWIERPIRWYCARSSSARTSSRKEGPLSGPKERSDVEADHAYPRLDHSSLDTPPLPMAQCPVTSGVMESDLEVPFTRSAAQCIARHSIAIPVQPA